MRNFLASAIVLTFAFAGTTSADCRGCGAATHSFPTSSCNSCGGCSTHLWKPDFTQLRVMKANLHCKLHTFKSAMHCKFQSAGHHIGWKMNRIGDHIGCKMNNLRHKLHSLGSHCKTRCGGCSSCGGASIGGNRYRAHALPTGTRLSPIPHGVAIN